MGFTSLAFLVFLAVVLTLYYLVPRRFQWVLLLIASYAFYLISGIPQVLFLLGTTAVTYFSGLWMQKVRNQYKARLAENLDLEKAEKQRRKKLADAKIHRIQVWTLVLDLLVLGIVKYSSFALENIGSLLRLFGSETELPGLHILVPLGISFYTFMAMGYTIDVGRGRYEAERNPGKLALFLSFFPCIVQGPICRYEEVGRQLSAEHPPIYHNISHGAQLILWGFFKKLVIADRVAPFVTSVFSAKMIDRLSGTSLFIGMLAYAAQIYCDFSGGIDIARGVAQMMGIDLPQNFQRPYFSASVAEYWRRWHMTLGDWMRQYVFYPIMLSKPITRLSKKVRALRGQQAAKFVPSVITPFCVFLLIGIWHGASWNYVAFGLYNAVLVSGGVLLEPVFRKWAVKCRINTDGKIWKVFRILRTFLLLSVSKILVKAGTLPLAFRAIGKICTNVNLSFGQELIKRKIDLGLPGYLVVVVSLLVLFTVSVLQEKGIHIRDTIERQRLPVRWLLYFLLLTAVLIFGVYGAEYDAAGFIYQTY